MDTLHSNIIQLQLYILIRHYKQTITLRTCCMEYFWRTRNTSTCTLTQDKQNTAPVTRLLRTLEAVTISFPRLPLITSQAIPSTSTTAPSVR